MEKRFIVSINILESETLKWLQVFMNMGNVDTQSLQEYILNFGGNYEEIANSEIIAINQSVQTKCQIEHLLNKVAIIQYVRIQ